MPRYIDADALLKHEIEADRMGAMLVVGKGYILSAPEVDAVPVVRGEWYQCSTFDEDENVYTCSICGEPWVLIDGTPPENNMNFCPNCGADMRETENKNDAIQLRKKTHS